MKKGGVAVLLTNGGYGKNVCPIGGLGVVTYVFNNVVELDFGYEIPLYFFQSEYEIIGIL